MLRTFFVNFLMSLLTSVIAAIIMFPCAALWGGIVEEFNYNLSTVLVLWVNIIISVVITFFFLCFYFYKVFKHFLGASNNISSFWEKKWDKKDTPIRYKQVVLAILPIVLLSVVFLLLFCFSYGKIINELETIMKTQDVEKFSPATLIIMCWISTIMCFLAEAAVMFFAYNEITCEECGAVGLIDFALEKTTKKTSHRYKESKSNEKIGSLQVNNKNIMDVYGEKTYYTPEEVQTTTEKYVGVCACCGHKNIVYKTDISVRNL